MNVDPITLEVMRNKLDGIANEMQLTLVRSAFSAIVKEGLDASASLFTLNGETLAQALAVPVHLGALTPMVGRLLATVPRDQMHEGDIWILNDTYLGGTHLPDIAIMTPVFADGRVIGEVLANLYREDLQLAGLGSGRHGFEFRLPAAMSPASLIEIRRALDGAALPMSGGNELDRKRASK